MKQKNPHHNLPDFDSELENDALWDILADAQPREASPRFLQDTVRRARLEPAPRAWWNPLTTRKLWASSLAATGAVTAVVALIISFPTDPAPPEQTTSAPPTPPAQWSELENALAREVLVEAAENPTLFSDQEIVALLY